jgi:hypothetical protein
MGWKEHETAVYLVSWDDRGMVKVGVTKCQRWRAFTLRGARLVDSWTVKDPYDLEQDVRAALANLWTPAFRDAASAVPFLGRRGAGWRECFIVPVQEAAELVAIALKSRTCPRSCIRMMRTQCGCTVREQCGCMVHGRTD